LVSASAYQRVSKQMVQMFGPQWVDKFGKTNDAWETALKDLTYSQIGVGLAKVMRGSLKFYEIDLPNFLELCKPPPAPKREHAMDRPKEWEGMTEDEIQFHCKANLKLVVWSCKHPTYGVDGPKKFTEKHKAELLKAAKQLAHDYYLMREELGKESVPDSDFFIALHRRWDRIVEE
jgi:hypothetical protein